MAKRNARTDTHRPTALAPSESEFVAVEYLKIEDLGTAQYLQQQRAVLRAHMDRTGGAWSTHAHGGNCMVCGNAQAIYTVAFYHAKTNSYVRMGQDCAADVDGLTWNSRDMDCMRRAVADARERKAGVAKAQALLSDAGLPQVWGMVQAFEAQVNAYSENWGEWNRGLNAAIDAVDPTQSSPEAVAADRLYRAHNVQPQYPQPAKVMDTMRDMVGKLVKYGSMSDKQVAYLRMLVQQVANWEAIQAQRAAEREQAQPAPVGRVVVQGEVLKVEARENDYGVRYVMTVKADAGWLCWGTVPSGLGDVQRGDRVQFTATLEPSARDPKFALYSRPAKAAVLASRAEQEAA